MDIQKTESISHTKAPSGKIPKRAPLDGHGFGHHGACCVPNGQAMPSGEAEEELVLTAGSAEVRVEPQTHPTYRRKEKHGVP